MKNNNEQFVRLYKKIELVAATMITNRNEQGTVESPACWLVSHYLKGDDAFMFKNCITMAEAVLNVCYSDLFEVSDTAITFLHKIYRDLAVDTGSAEDVMFSKTILQPTKETETPQQAARRFIRGCEYLPVLSSAETLAAIITKTDIMELLLEGDDRSLKEIIKERPGMKVDNYAFVAKTDAAPHVKSCMENGCLNCILVSDFGDPAGRYHGMIIKDCF